MANCEDCIHNDICSMVDYYNAEGCGAFRDRALFVKLPLKFEQSFYYIKNDAVVEDKLLRVEIDNYGYMSLIGHQCEFYADDIGTLCFLTREEADHVREVESKILDAFMQHLRRHGKM